MISVIRSKRTAASTRTAIAVSTTVLIAVAALAQSGIKKLILNGRTASTDVRMIDGRPYVPLADVAAALGQKVSVISGGYEITTPGGANQVVGLVGKIGDMLFDGAWRFQVNDVRDAQTYTETHTLKGKKDWSAPDGSRLILVDVTIKNGSTHQSWLQLWPADQKILTALAGDDGTAIKVTSYDMVTASGEHHGGGGDWDYTPKMLPGSEQKMTLVFVAPKDFAPKDLVFTLPYPPVEFAQLKYSNLRISLKK